MSNLRRSLSEPEKSGDFETEEVVEVEVGGLIQARTCLE